MTDKQNSQERDKLIASFSRNYRSVDSNDLSDEDVDSTDSTIQTKPSMMMLPEETIPQETREPSWLEKKLASQFSVSFSKTSDGVCTGLLLTLSLAFLYCLLGDEMLPSHDMFRLVILMLGACVGGFLCQLIKLPALLGMLIVGVVLRSTGFFHVSGVYRSIVTLSRNIALSVILIKAGLGLDPKALARMKYTVLNLSLLPCLGEAVAAAIISHYVMGFSWLWGFLLGFLLSPISPAVVVPTLLDLQERGYGSDKGIATLVIAASSIDDIAAISIFGVLLSNKFSSGGSMVMEICRGPLELILGIVIGFAWGVISSVLPHRRDKNASEKRIALIGLGGIVMVLLALQLDFPGFGPLACITGAFVANIGWTLQESGSNWLVTAGTLGIIFTQPHSYRTENIVKFFSKLWLVVQPILFGLIGAEIDVTILDVNSILSACAVILGALMVRILVCWFALYGGVDLNAKEKMFVILAWVPKATVQAALAPQALEFAQRELSMGRGNDVDLKNSRLVLVTAVIAILIAAPLGSIALNLTGPKFLTKTTSSLSSGQERKGKACNDKQAC